MDRQSSNPWFPNHKLSITTTYLFSLRLTGGFVPIHDSGGEFIIMLTMRTRRRNGMMGLPMVGETEYPQAKAGFDRIELHSRQVQPAQRDDLPDFIHRVMDRRAQPHFTQECH